MGKAITGLKSAKRFGARYGRRIKALFEKAEKVQREDHKCPYCHAIKVRRLAVGIWTCKKCCMTFTGKAYVPYEKQKVMSEETGMAEISEGGE